MSARQIAALLLTLLLATPIVVSRLDAAGNFDAKAALARGHEVAGYIVNVQPAPLWPMLSPRMREALHDSASVARVLAGIQAQTGTLDSTLGERVEVEDGLQVYKADCKFARAPVPLTVSVTFDDEGRVAGMFVKQAGPPPTAYDSPHLSYVPKTRLRLPFKGEWTVVWGGRTIEQNYHARTRDQRFALDLLMKKDGKTHAGDGAKLTDYYCYGQPVLSPAAGRIVWMRDSLPDNQPGGSDRKNPTGNCVIVDHGNQEYSLLAHMQPNSLRFKLGDPVNAGDVIGLCGNSGNTSEPHIHYHLQDGPVFHEADGLPPKFYDLFVNDVHADTAEVVQGQRIRPAK